MRNIFIHALQLNKLRPHMHAGNTYTILSIHCFMDSAKQSKSLSYRTVSQHTSKQLLKKPGGFCAFDCFKTCSTDRNILSRTKHLLYHSIHSGLCRMDALISLSGNSFSCLCTLSSALLMCCMTACILADICLKVIL